MHRPMRAAPLVLAALACIAQPADSPKVVSQAVSRDTIVERLNAVPRKLADRVATLESIFHQAGCEGDRFREQPVPGSKAPNLICEIPADAGSEIVVGGHLDSIEAGMGAVDDWSGAVLLPSLYQSLSGTPRRHRFVFVAFAAEERGLAGSFAFASRLKKDEMRRIDAMINLECLGVGPPEVWASRANKRLLEAYSKVASILNMEARGMNVDGAGDDDSHSFLRFGVPVLTIHSLTPKTLRIIHHPSDNLSAIHLDDYYATYRLAAAYLAYLDSALE